MQIFFWDFKDYNDIARQWGLFIFNLIVFIYTFFAFCRTWRHYRKCMFEMFPLSVNIFAAFTLLLLKLFERGYEFDEIGHLIQIFVYFLFCYTFALMYARTLKRGKRKLIQKVWSIILFIMFLIIITTTILILMRIISHRCDRNKQKWLAIITLAFEFISFFPTAFFGFKILKKIISSERKTRQYIQHDSVSLSQLRQFSSDLYYLERVKQIKLVLTAYVVSIILRLIVSITILMFQAQIFVCIRIDDVSIITSQQAVGQIILVLNQINQLLPHIVIPIAMYLIPLRKMRAQNETFHIDSSGNIKQENDEQNFYQFQDQSDSKLSSLLNSRFSQENGLRSPSTPILKS